MLSSPRCGAKTRSGKPCRAPIAKADQFGAGRLAYLSAETVVHTCRWHKTAGLDRGRVFRAIDPDETPLTALASDAVARTIKYRAKRSGLDAVQVARLSGHFMRVGAAQDMAAAGIDLVVIMHAGGWKSPEMVMRERFSGTLLERS